MKITDKVHVLRLDFKISFSPNRQIERFVNSVIIFDEKITIIDTGTKTAYRNIFKYIEDNGRNIADIDLLILSHSHPDHIGSAAEIKRKTNCRVIAHSEAKAWIENVVLQNKERPVPGFYNLVDEPVFIDEIITDNETIKVGEDLSLEIIHTPGHSRGSISILILQEAVLFTADAIPVSRDLPNYDNFMEMRQSLQLITEMKDYFALLTSWTPPVIGEPDKTRLFSEAFCYMNELDEAVKKYYTEKEFVPLENCGKVVGSLCLPDFYVNPIADKAFKSHLS